MPTPTLYDVKAVNFLSDLRDVDVTTWTSPEHYQILYVKYHSWVFDFGGGYFYFNPLADANDDDGIVIKPNVTLDDDKGRWFRKFDGYVNVRYYGCIGNFQPDDGNRIQKAMDYAASTPAYSKGCNTVFIPGGAYKIHNQLFLRDGVSVIGDSFAKTIFYAGYPDELTPERAEELGSSYGNYMWVMDKGRITGCNIANIQFLGMVPVTEKWDPKPETGPTAKTKGCMYFEAIATINYGVLDGGMWSCTFKNLQISGFNGSGIVYIGGTDTYAEPNQFNIFEGVYVSRQKETSHGLYMIGEHGQFTFLNCGMSGIFYNQVMREGVLVSTECLKGMNVALIGKGTHGLQPAVISFINSTFQQSEYGIYAEYSESVTFDTCWFENLDLAVTATYNEWGPSKAINVLNCRFANASGFGSLPVSNQHVNNPPFDYAGRIISASKSEMNVYNSYVCVSDMNEKKPYSPLHKNFILGLDPNLGVRTMGNSFQDYRLGFSYGIMQYVSIEADTDPEYGGTFFLDLQDSKLVFAKPGPYNGKEIERIVCSVSAGETISIRADQKTITFNNKKNIFLSGKSNLVLNNGDIGTFVKIDNTVGPNYPSPPLYPESYQLISVFKSSSPS